MAARRLISSAALAGTLVGCGTSGGLLGGDAQTSSAESAAVYAQMTDADVNMANAALDSALETRVSGAAVSWRNPATGSYGSVTPLATFRASDGSFCRRYREVVIVAGRRARQVDVACRRGRRLWIPLES